MAAIKAPVPDASDTPTRGRRRDASRDDALRRAAIELLAEVGYDRLTIDAVAARARAGKGTVYRRWANKADLLVDALTHRFAPVGVPDTGSVRGDLEALIAGAEEDDQEFRTRLFSGLVPALVQFPELRAAFQGASSGSDVVRDVVERGVQRGEIAAPKSPELIAAVFPALALYRFVMFGEGPDPTFSRTVLDEVIMPLVQGSSPT
jgi:AcrR family transcriptional regulator